MKIVMKPVRNSEGKYSKSDEFKKLSFSDSYKKVHVAKLQLTNHCATYYDSPGADVSQRLNEK